MTTTPAVRPEPARTIDARAEALWRWLQRVVRSTVASSSATGAVTLTETDGLVLADATAGAFAVTLPPAADVPGTRYNVKKIDASANAVTVTPSGAETIDGAATVALTTQWQSITVQSNGTAWYEIAVAPASSGGGGGGGASIDDMLAIEDML